MLANGDLLVDATCDLVTLEFSCIHANWCPCTYSSHLDVRDLCAGVVIAEGEGGCRIETNMRKTLKFGRRSSTGSDCSNNLIPKMQNPWRHSLSHTARLSLLSTFH